MPAREQKVQKHLIPDRKLEEMISTIEGYYEPGGYTDDKLVVLCCQHCEEADWTEGALSLYQHFRGKFTNPEVSEMRENSQILKQ